ncbi:hypothetical protein MKW92_037142 [Papaver armeniacum]|nr:hypothetical protein MKW92_037142 [Papaver armeniacum]
MQITMLKVTPTFHPITSNIFKKPQTHYTNFPNINITRKKPFQISSCKIDAADVSKAAPLLKNVSNSTFTSDKLQLHVSPLDAVFSTVKSVFSSMIKLVSSQFVEEDPLVVENDLILFKHNGVEIIGEVQQVVHHEDGLMETTLQCESGLEKFNISIYDIYNLTSLDEKEKEKMWRIYTSVECKDDDLEKMVEEIKDALDARDELKCNSKYSSVGVKSIYPNKTIVVISFVTCSKLKTPRFQHYMEVRKKLLSEIDEIRRKHE